MSPISTAAAIAFILPLSFAMDYVPSASRVWNFEQLLAPRAAEWRPTDEGSHGRPIRTKAIVTEHWITLARKMPTDTIVWPAVQRRE